MLAQLDTHKITNFLQKTYLGDIEVQFIRVYGLLSYWSSLQVILDLENWTETF